MTSLYICDIIDKPHITGYKWVSPPDSSETNVKVGTEIHVEKLAQEENSEVKFQVVALGGENGLKIGTPYVEGASVTGKVLKNGKGKKITVFTYRPKKGSKRKMGHRQPYTKVEISAINA